MDKGLWELGRDEFPVCERVRVRYNEIDGQSIVFNGNYFIYGDIGVTEYFRMLGEGQPGPFFHQYGTDIYVVHAEIDYHASAVLDDMIDICARVSRIGRTSFTLHVAIFRGEERLTDILIVYAHMDLDTGQSTPLPAGFVADVRQAQKTPPAQDAAKKWD